MIKQREIRSGGGRQVRLFRLIAGAIILATTACAEIEVGTELYKNAARTSGPVGKTGLSSSATPDAIDTSLRADPEAFYATGLALWDGERTLAGVWIAHPEAQVARQVRLTNSETGTRVDAAMFRRDPNLSGPRIIVSSEAAESLGLAPNLGTQIVIEGLAYGPADAAVATAPATEPVATPAEIQVETATTEPVAIEVTPVASIDAELDTVPEATPAVSIADTGNSNGAQPISSTANWDSKAEIERARLAKLQAPSTAFAVSATTAPLPLSRPTDPAPVREIGSEPESAPVASGDIADGRHFIQAGVFGQPENATRLVEKLRAANLPAEEVSLTLGDRQFTRVVIGPFQTIAERNDALEIVRTVGPADAAPVRG